MVDSIARRKHLGQGVSFPMRIDRQGSLTLSRESDSIEESILIILLTEPGERRYRPDFGCRIHQLAFAPLNTETLMLIKIWVGEALEKWEPRIEIENIITQPINTKGQVNISINYRLKNSYDRRSLIYPFFLKRE
ncbi:GPW/gp25 family protein [Pleurocapsales cyanobacterium LEGE 10410]|nr:GPW/gp25 family protein [Pleurocapsales cyanobacterium LEGE 10410]